jgi:hypothetical protein
VRLMCLNTSVSCCTTFGTFVRLRQQLALLETRLWQKNGICGNWQSTRVVANPPADPPPGLPIHSRYRAAASFRFLGTP